MCHKAAHYAHWKKNAAKHWGRRQGRHFGFPPVNVQELDDQYEIWLYAAGYEKGDFEVTLKDNTMFIVVDKSNEEQNGEANWRRREFKPRSFARSFELNEKIDKESIVAIYEGGILKVTSRKKAEFETQRTSINVL